MDKDQGVGNAMTDATAELLHEGGGLAYPDDGLNLKEGFTPVTLPESVASFSLAVDRFVADVRGIVETASAANRHTFTEALNALREEQLDLERRLRG